VTVAYDVLSFGDSGTGDYSWTHTPVGTPAGVVVFIADNATTTDNIDGVTYGGISMTEMAGSPFVGAAGVVQGYFLGASVPTGAQTVAVDTNTNTDSRGFAITMTGAADLVVQDTTGLATSGSGDLTGTLALGGNTCFCLEAFWSALGGLAGPSPLTGWTSANENDRGADIVGCYTYDTVDTSDVTFGVNHANPDAVAVLAAAITEDAGGAPTAEGALASQAADIAGTATRTVKAAGSLSAGPAVIDGAALRAALAAGVIEAQLASIAGVATAGNLGSAVIESVFSDDARGDGFLLSAVSANADEVIIIGASNTDAGMFGTPFDNVAGSVGWNLVYSDSDAYSTFELGIAVWYKVATGGETSITLSPAGGTGALDAITWAGAVVSGLDTSDPFDVSGYVSSATGTGTSLAATLDSTTTQDRSLLTFFAAYRDDDADGSESWTGSMVTSRYVEHNNADVNVFDSALWLGTENVVSAGAHSRTWSTSGAAEEVYGVMLAWNVAASGNTAIGALASQDAGISGAALRTAFAEGDLAVQAAIIEGIAARTALAAGSLESGAADIAGEAAATGGAQIATGALQAGPATVAGAATRAAKAIGEIVSGAAGVSAAAELVRKALGALVSGAATIAGLILRGWHTQPSPGETWTAKSQGDDETWYDDTPGGGETWH
jgi:hypothetical protein